MLLSNERAPRPDDRALSGSVDITRVIGLVEITGTVFGSQLRHATQRRDAGTDRVELINATRHLLGSPRSSFRPAGVW